MKHLGARMKLLYSSDVGLQWKFVIKGGAKAVETMSVHSPIHWGSLRGVPVVKREGERESRTQRGRWTERYKRYRGMDRETEAQRDKWTEGERRDWDRAPVLLGKPEGSCLELGAPAPSSRKGPPFGQRRAGAAGRVSGRRGPEGSPRDFGEGRTLCLLTGEWLSLFFSVSHTGSLWAAEKPQKRWLGAPWAPGALSPRRTRFPAPAAARLPAAPASARGWPVTRSADTDVSAGRGSVEQRVEGGSSVRTRRRGAWARRRLVPPGFSSRSSSPLIALPAWVLTPRGPGPNCSQKLLSKNEQNRVTLLLSTLWFSSVQALSCVRLFANPWTAAGQAFLSITNSRSSLKLMSIVSVMPSSHPILCRPLLLLPSIFPSIRVFANDSALHLRWPKYWSVSFSISPSNEYSGLISFRMDWLDLLAVQGTRKSLLQHYSSKASILQHSAFCIVRLSHHTWLLEKP